MKPIISRNLAATALASLLWITACAPSPPAPIAKGQIVLCTLGDKPVMRAGETGSWGGRNLEGTVEIYEHIIIVTESNGTRHAAPPDWFSVITFK